MTDPSPDGIRFARLTVGAESALSESDATKFEGTLSGVGSVVESNGIYHMLYNDIQGGWPPRQIAVGHAISDDGVAWRRASPDPVLSADDLPYPGYHIFASSLLVDDDGTWVVYFHVVADEAASGQGDGIGRATAPAPEGPWTVHPEILLAPDPSRWDSFGLWAPNVVRTDTGFNMYYTGIGEPPNPEIAIGMAASDDGVSWSRRAQPALTRGAPGSWDERKVEQGQVTVAGDRWFMVYRTDTAAGTFGSSGSAFGLAVSEDGVEWHRYQDEPVLTPGDDSAWRVLWSAGVVPSDETLGLIFEAEGPYSGTRWFPVELQLPG